MALFKTKVSEPEAAALFGQHIFERAQEKWPAVSSGIAAITRELAGEPLTFENERFATFDYALATLAVEAQALWNLFDQEQADRTFQWVLKGLNTPEFGEYASEAVESYCSLWRDGLAEGRNPIPDLAGMLIVRWFGDDARKFTFTAPNGEEALDPILVTAAMSTLTGFGGFWKKVKSDYKLVRGDLPLSHPNDGLRGFELAPMPREGTAVIRDTQGRYHERPIAPEQVEALEALADAGVAKRIYKILVKGPWAGIKEMDRELTDEMVRRFVEAKSGAAYAVCYYEKEQPHYFLVPKHMWEQWDEAVKAMSDPRLSSDERQRVLKRYFAAAESV